MSHFGALCVVHVLAGWCLTYPRVASNVIPAFLIFAILQSALGYWWLPYALRAGMGPLRATDLPLAIIPTSITALTLTTPTLAGLALARRREWCLPLLWWFGSRMGDLFVETALGSPLVSMEAALRAEGHWTGVVASELTAFGLASVITACCTMAGWSVGLRQTMIPAAILLGLPMLTFSPSPGNQPTPTPPPVTVMHLANARIGAFPAERLSQVQAGSLAIWPETAFRGKVPRDSKVPPEHILSSLVPGAWNIWVAESSSFSGPTLSAFATSPDGHNRYLRSKRTLIPFAERSFFGMLLPGSKNLQPGSESTMVQIGDHKIGLLICYEAMFEELAGQAIEEGATLIAILASDRFAADVDYARNLGFQHAQYLATRYNIPVVRASMQGPSAIFEAGGAVLATTNSEENEILIPPSARPSQ